MAWSEIVAAIWSGLFVISVAIMIRGAEPVVVVALLPMRTHPIVSDGASERSSVEVAHADEPPPEPCRSVLHVGVPPTSLSTVPSAPFVIAETTPLRCWQDAGCAADRERSCREIGRTSQSLPQSSWLLRW